MTAQRLFRWHGALFPSGRSGFFEIDVARWRTDRNGPMQIVSGAEGRTKTIHFEAPPANAVAKEMDAFLSWLAAANPIDGLCNAALAHLWFVTIHPFDDGLCNAALAHLWFVTIHPFDDGNGRIARAIADYAIARMEAPGPRFYSMSGQIERDRKRYYDRLEAAQKGDLDVTEWMLWFIGTYRAAVVNAENVVNRVVEKARFWRFHAGKPVNPRQKKVIDRLIDGFEGKMTSSRWASIAQTSQDTGYRDILDLIAKGILVKEDGAARKTAYRLVVPPRLQNPEPATEIASPTSSMRP